jgi:hypothetical protein
MMLVPRRRSRAHLRKSLIVDMPPPLQLRQSSRDHVIRKFFLFQFALQFRPAMSPPSQKRDSRIKTSA